MLVTVQHAIACGYCVNGIRTFFKKHGLDFKAFVNEGIDEERLTELNDSMADKVVGVANGYK